MPTRRQLTGLLTAGLGASMAGLATRSRAQTPPASVPEHLRLAPVRVEYERIIRVVAGLRPYRAKGFVVRGDQMGDKLLVHNYGHGGGGVTLSWGTSDLAVDIGFQGADKSYAVLGCGAVGLATARLLQERGGKVTIYAADLPPNTTSNIAGAQWWPYLVYEHGNVGPEYLAQHKEAAGRAYRRWQTMVGDYFGVSWRRNFSLSDNINSVLPGATGSVMEGLAPEAHNIPPGAHPFGPRWLQQFDTMHIEPPIYLHAVLNDFHLAGGTLKVRKFNALEQISSLREDVVFNCTGLGSRELFGDRGLVPVKGQLVVLLPQPEVDYNLLIEGDYMFPRRDGIVLGGTHQEGVFDLEPDWDQAKRVMKHHTEIFGSMSV